MELYYTESQRGYALWYVATMHSTFVVPSSRFIRWCAGPKPSDEQQRRDVAMAYLRPYLSPSFSA